MSQQELNIKLGILREMREKLAEIDAELLAVVNRRLTLVAQMQEFKRDYDVPPVDAGREHWTADFLRRVNEGPLSDDGVRGLITFVLLLTRREVGFRDDGRYDPETAEIPY